MIEVEDQAIQDQTRSALATSEAMTQSSNASLERGGRKSMGRIGAAMMALSVAGLGSGCANTMSQGEAAAVGGMVSAAAAQVLGADTAGTIASAVAGAGIGAVINEVTQDKLEQAAIDSDIDIEVKRIDDSTIRMKAPSDAVFGFDSAEPSPQMNAFLSDVQDALHDLATDEKVMLHMIGSASLESPNDAQSVAYNEDLAERRAQGVESLAHQLYTQEPTEANVRLVSSGSVLEAMESDQPGSAEHRRVDIDVHAVSEDADFSDLALDEEPEEPDPGRGPSPG